MIRTASSNTLTMLDGSVDMESASTNSLQRPNATDAELAALAKMRSNQSNKLSPSTGRRQANPSSSSMSSIARVTGIGSRTLRRHLAARPEDKLRAMEDAVEYEQGVQEQQQPLCSPLALCRRLYRSVSRLAARRLADPASVVKLVALGCIVFILITTFGPNYGPIPVGLLNVNGTLCPRVTVCAETWHAMLLLGISRSGAYFCYPFIMLLFLTKTNNLRTFLQRSFLAEFIPFHDLHSLHVLAGRIVALDITVHSCCHITRWAVQGNGNLIWLHQTGVSGAISFLLTPLIALPMMWERLRKVCPPSPPSKLFLLPSPLQ